MLREGEIRLLQSHPVSLSHFLFSPSYSFKINYEKCHWFPGKAWVWPRRKSTLQFKTVEGETIQWSGSANAQTVCNYRSRLGKQDLPREYSYKIKQNSVTFLIMKYWWNCNQSLWGFSLCPLFACVCVHTKTKEKNHPQSLPVELQNTNHVALYQQIFAELAWVYGLEK